MNMNTIVMTCVNKKVRNLMTCDGQMRRVVRGSISRESTHPEKRKAMAIGPPYPWEPPAHIRPEFHPPKRWHVYTGRYMCALMWFWMLYRAKEDGPVMLGLRHPWEHKHEHEKH